MKFKISKGQMNTFHMAAIRDTIFCILDENDSLLYKLNSFVLYNLIKFGRTKALNTINLCFQSKSYMVD